MSLKNLLREHEYDLRVAYRRLRQKLFIARVKAMAKFERATVEFDFAPDVQIGHGVRVIVWPGTHTTFKLGPKSWLRDNVVIHMKGGSFVGGIRTDLRQNVAVQIEGRIILDGENTISYGCVVAQRRVDPPRLRGDHGRVRDDRRLDPLPHHRRRAGG